MGKLFDWLGGVLNPTGEKPESRKVSEGSPVLQGEKDTPSQESGSLGHFTDAQDVQDTISECLVREMGMFRGGSGYPDLTLWIDDPVASLLAESLQERLKKDLLHSGCRPLNPKTCVTVREGAPAEGVKVVVLSSKGKLNSGKVFLSFALEKASGDKAVISVYWGKGSLMASSYEIDPSVKARYRIGRGQTSSRPDYSFRVPRRRYRRSTTMLAAPTPTWCSGKVVSICKCFLPEAFRETTAPGSSGTRYRFRWSSPALTILCGMAT